MSSRAVQIAQIAEILARNPGQVGVDAAIHRVASAIEGSSYAYARQRCAGLGVNTFENESFQSAYNHSLYNLRYKLDGTRPRPNTELVAKINYCIRVHRYCSGALAAAVCDQILPLGSLAIMRPEELAPELYAANLAEYDLRKNVKLDIVYATHYKCICGVSKTIVRTVQMRSADEGTTDLIRCIACNRHWKKTG